MQIQPINKTNYQSTFKAKLSARTLKTLTEEAKSLEQGNETLKTILDKIEKIGNKNTVLDFGIVTKHSRTEHYNGSAAYDYMDEEDYEVKCGLTFLTLSNHIFPYASHTYTLELNENDNLFNFLQKSFDKGEDKSAIKFYVEDGEVNLFKNYITDFKEKNPEKSATKETFDMIDAINSAFKSSQAIQMVDNAQNIDATEISAKYNTINAEIRKFKNSKMQLTKRAKETEDLAASMLKILEDNSKSKTKEIYDRYI